MLTSTGTQVTSEWDTPNFVLEVIVDYPGLFLHVSNPVSHDESLLPGEICICHHSPAVVGEPYVHQD